MKYIIAFLCTTWLLFAQNVTAQILTENEATPSMMSETGAILLITEVNFKNNEADWAEIYYESPTGKAINLKGLSFGDDHVFKKIETDFWLPSKQYSTLIFNSEAIDATPFLATTRTGLTGTTEQLILYDRNNNVIDAVCWRNSKPTTSEMEDFTKLYQQNGWNSPDINTCTDSTLVKTNNSIIRNNMSDTNMAIDWEISTTTTPGAQNSSSQNLTSPSETALISKPISGIEPDTIIVPSIITTQPTTTAKAPISSTPTLSIPPKTSTTKQTTSTSSTSTPKKIVAKTTSSSTNKSKAKKKSTYKNGNLSTDIHISEIFPNPEKDDTKNEWIELVNVGENDINLGNWLLDDNDGGSKPYRIPDTTVISAGAALLIPITESKLSLGNTSDTVRIFDYNDELIDTVDYEDAPSGSSYAHITVTNDDDTTEENWLWLKQPSPGEPNPSYRSITGIVVKEPLFEGNPGFDIQNSNEEIFTVHFTEDVIAAPFAKTTFLPGTQIKLILEKNDNDTYQLRGYEILGTNAEKENISPMLPAIIMTILVLGGTTILWSRKNKSTKNSYKELLKLKT